MITYTVWRVFTKDKDIAVQNLVINQKTHKIHTAWIDLTAAKLVAEDLNKMIKMIEGCS